MKYGINSDDFFDSFVEAWKYQQSKCKSLLIECRKRTRNYAVFLITDSFKVVAQFSIPKRILEETSACMHLKSGMNRINLKASVIEIQKPRSVITRFGGFATVTNVSVKDETGIIQLPLWNKQIDAVSVGDIIQVENARVVTFRGERQLRVGRGGHLSVVEKM